MKWCQRKKKKKILSKVYLHLDDHRNGVLNEFQCFFVFRHGEWKSREITCKCTLCMLGCAWKPILNSSLVRPLTSITFCARNSISRNIPMLSLVNYICFRTKKNDECIGVYCALTTRTTYIKYAVNIGQWHNEKMIFCFWKFIFDGDQIFCWYQ